MKQISITAYELSREEVQKMEDLQSIIVYDPIFRRYTSDDTGKNCIANHKHARNDLIYISLDDKEHIKFKVDDK